MFQDEIDKVEQPALQQLQKLGWEFAPSAELVPAEDGERSYYRDVVLVGRLEQALRRLNPWLSDENLRKVMREFTHPNHASLLEYNHALYSLLVNC